MRIKKAGSTLVMLFYFICAHSYGVCASESDAALFDEAYPYAKYFLDRALPPSSGFAGCTPSFQLYYGGQSVSEENIIAYGASSYDQTILGRIALRNNDMTVLDTFSAYYRLLDDKYNPLVNSNSSYYDAINEPINNGPYRLMRILGRDIANFWQSWDWTVDTGSGACLILYAIEGYERTLKAGYKEMAVTIGEYVLRLQDTDGGIRYGPRGMYHDPEAKSDFYWNLKSTEQNERLLAAMRRLYAVTGDERFRDAAENIASWLKLMYDTSVHLFHAAASYAAGWTATDFGYVTSDVTAFAPLEIMVDDTFFGDTAEARCEEIDNMFAALETRCAFYNTDGDPIFFRFSVSQTGDYGSVEMSSQMAVAYFKASRLFYERGDMARAEKYHHRYDTLSASLAGFFFTPEDDPAAKVAPYASYKSGAAAGGVPTGTGYYTFNCFAALASSYYGLMKIEASDYSRAELTQIITPSPEAGKIVAAVRVTDGIEESDGLAWSSVSSAVPEQMLAADIDGCGEKELVVDFGPRYGVWIRYAANGWSKIHEMSPTVMASGDIDNDGNEDIIMSFGQYGVWAYTGKGLWVLMHVVPAYGLACGDIDGDGVKETIMDFGRTYGIWARSLGGAWQQIHVTSAASILCADIDADGADEIVVDFGSRYGIWARHADCTWSMLHGSSARIISSGDNDGDGAADLAIDFGDGAGIWVHYGTGVWAQAHSMSGYAILMADIDDDGHDELIVDFGIRYGIWVKYFDGRWYNLKPGRA